jgi:hypothetical protein
MGCLKHFVAMINGIRQLKSCQLIVLVTLDCISSAIDQCHDGKLALLTKFKMQKRPVL